MELSVIILNYKTPRETYECALSCLKESSNIKLEIIIVDNGSDDNSWEYLNHKLNKSNNVILIRNPKNFGFSKGVNVGLIKAAGKYKYLLNSDTRIPKGIFLQLINYTKTHPDVGIVGSKLILPDGSIQKSCYNLPMLKNAVSEFWMGKKHAFSGFAPLSENPTAVEAVVGASFFISPQVYEKVGLFEERYFMYYEDLDYCRKVLKGGYKIIYHPGITVFHHHGLSGKKFSDKGLPNEKLIASSKIYHGILKHYLINFVLWSGQAIRSIINNNEKQVR